MIRSSLNWDEDDERPVKGKKAPTTRDGADRIEMDPESEAARDMWVEAVKSFNAIRNGIKHSKYNSCPRWDGGFDKRSGITYKRPIWPKIVSTAKEHGLIVEDLIKATFDVVTGEFCPVPTATMQAATIHRAMVVKSLRRRRVAEALRNEETVFRTDLRGAMVTIPDPTEATRFVLNDVGRPMSPLFRYSLALLKGLDDIAERWADLAVTQFERNQDAYQELWAAILPEPMRTAKAVTGRPSF